MESLGDFIQMRVPAAHHQRQRRKLHRTLARDRVNMPLDVVHRDQRQPVRHRQSLGVRHAHQQRSHQSRTLRHRDRAQIT